RERAEETASAAAGVLLSEGQATGRELFFQAWSRRCSLLGDAAKGGVFAALAARVDHLGLFIASNRHDAAAAGTLIDDSNLFDCAAAGFGCELSPGRDCDGFALRASHRDFLIRLKFLDVFNRCDRLERNPRL